MTFRARVHVGDTVRYKVPGGGLWCGGYYWQRGVTEVDVIDAADDPGVPDQLGRPPGQIGRRTWRELLSDGRDTLFPQEVLPHEEPPR